MLYLSGCNNVVGCLFQSFKNNIIISQGELMVSAVSLLNDNDLSEYWFLILISFTIIGIHIQLA